MNNYNVSSDSLSSSLDDDSDNKEADNINLVLNDLELQRLEDSLRQNVFNYDGQLTRIQALRARKEWSEVRRARESMAAVFPLTEQLWLQWIEDEIKLAESQDERAAVLDLFERAVNDYLSVRVWREYVLFVRDVLGDEQRAATILDRALAAAGLHMHEGNQLWALLVQTRMSGTETELRDAFRRWLSVPHSQHEATLARYRAWESEPDQTPAVQAILNVYERCAVQTSQRSPFEHKVQELSAPGADADALVNAWCDYIAYEMDQAESGSPARVLMLYERCLSQLPLRADLWQGYVQFCSRRLAVTPDGCRATSAVVDRALRNVPWTGSLHVSAVRVAEQAGPETCTPEFVVAAVLRGSSNQLAGGATDYASLMTAAVDCAVRSIRQQLLIVDPENQSQSRIQYDQWASVVVEAIRAGSEGLRVTNNAGLPPTLAPVEQAAWALSTVFRSARIMAMTVAIDNNDEDDGNDGETEITGVDAARRLFAEYLKNKRAAVNAQAWVKCIDWEERFGGPDDTILRRCRPLWKRALAQCAGGQAGPPRRKNYQPPAHELARLAANGSYLQSLRLQFESRWNPSIADWLTVEQEAKEAAILAATTQHQADVERAEKQGRAEALAAVDESTTPKMAAPQSKKRAATGARESGGQAAPSSKRKKTDDSRGATARTAGRVERHEDSDMRETNGADAEPEFSLYVGNLPFHVTEPQLKALFDQKLGGPDHVKSVRIMCNANGVSKGRGFVHFFDDKTRQLAADMDGYQFDGRAIRVSFPTSKGSQAMAAEGQPAVNEDCVVYVSNLPADTSPVTLRHQFSTIGPVREVRKKPNRTFAYVEFEQEASVAKAVAELNGANGINVAKSNPPPKKPLSLVESTRKEALIEAAHAGVAPARAGPRAALMRPRSVAAAAATPNTAAAAKPGRLSAPAPLLGDQRQSNEESSAVPKSNQDFRKMLGL